MPNIDNFQLAIKEYLDKRSKEDELFAVSYAKEGKSIEDCCTYIISEVQKKGRNGFADSEIFGLAVHYYDEDNLEIGSPIDCRIIVNKPIELTDEEKRQAREDAILKYQDDYIKGQKQKAEKPKAKVVEFKQASLFD